MVSFSTARRSRLAALLLATALVPAAMPLLPDHGWRVGFSRAEARENVVIDRIEIPNANGSVVLSGINATGSSLGRAEIEALFKSNSLLGLGDRLAKLDADLITIKSLEWRFKNDIQDMMTTYEGFEAKGIKAGLIERLTIAKGRQVATMKPPKAEKPQKSDSTFGKFSIEALDMASMARWITDSDPSGKAPMKQLHGRYEIESMAMTLDEAKINFGRAVFSGLKARLGKKSLLDFMPLIEATSKNSEDKEAGLQMLAAFLDIYSSFEIGEGTLDSIKVLGPDKGKPNGAQIEASIGRVGFGGGAKPYANMSDIAFKASDGFMALKKASFEGDFYGLMLLSFERGIKMMAEIEGKGPPSKAELDMQKIVSEAAAAASKTDIMMRIEGLEGDVPPGKDSKSPERVKFSLGSFHVGMGSFVSVTPTRLDYGLANFKMPVPANSTDQGLKTLREMGITTLDFSAVIKGKWEEGKQRFLVETIAGELANFARVNIAGEIGNVPRTLFEDPAKNWPIAMMGSNMQNLTVALENKGGLQKALDKVAAEQKKSPEQFKKEISTITPALLAGFMAGHPDAQAVAGALTKFYGTLGALSLTAKSANPAGISFMELAGASSDPTAFIQKLKFEASAK